MKTLLAISVLGFFMLAAAPVQAQRYNCGVGRWVNGRFVCPPGQLELLQDQLRANERAVIEQNRVIREQNRLQREIAARPPPPAQPAQVIIVREPAPVVPVVEKPAIESPPDKIHRRTSETGTPYFSNVQ